MSLIQLSCRYRGIDQIREILKDRPMNRRSLPRLLSVALTKQLFELYMSTTGQQPYTCMAITSHHIWHRQRWAGDGMHAASTAHVQYQNCRIIGRISAPAHRNKTPMNREVITSLLTKLGPNTRMWMSRNWALLPSPASRWIPWWLRPPMNETQTRPKVPLRRH